MRMRLPDSFVATAELQAASPVEPRLASTIVLLRDAPVGLEAYLLRRQPTMEFAPGMYVFPGGGLDEADHRVRQWIGPEPDLWADRFGCASETARALVVAAVRETFEESGVLLAGADENSVFGDTAGLEAERLALDRGELAFADFLQERKLMLRADLLGAWSRWITPEFEKRRYDTHFFVAAMPEGQCVGSLPGEADQAHWAPIVDIMRKVKEGNASMLPPTFVTCREVMSHSAGTVVEASELREIEAITPQLVEEDGAWYVDNFVEEV